MGIIAPKERDFPFFHVFQPVMDLRDDSIYGFEVLLRSPDGRNPELIFEEARQQGSLFELDIHSIIKGCEAGAKTFNEIHLMINVFPSTMVHPEFLPVMKQTVEHLQLKPENLVLEINEAEKKEQFCMLHSVVKQLKQTGYMIALDDIGKGDATLQSIIDFEPDVVKLDRYFMRDLGVSHKKRKYLKKIIELFGEDMHFVLEGLETAEDLRISKSLDISLGQGFYLGRPQPSSFYKNEA